MPLSEDDKADLVAYLDGELDEPATQAIEAKIATDPDARAEYDALKQTWGLLDYLPKASPSPNFTHRTLERLTLETVARPGTKSVPVAAPTTAWLPRLGWIAAVILALVGGYLATLRFRHDEKPPDPIPDADRELIRHLRIAERWRYYENVDDVDFAKKLNHPDLFGEDPS